MKQREAAKQHQSTTSPSSESQLLKGHKKTPKCPLKLCQNKGTRRQEHPHPSRHHLQPHKQPGPLPYLTCLHVRMTPTTSFDRHSDLASKFFCYRRIVEGLLFYLLQAWTQVWSTCSALAETVHLWTSLKTPPLMTTEQPLRGVDLQTQMVALPHLHSTHQISATNPTPLGRWLLAVLDLQRTTSWDLVSTATLWVTRLEKKGFLHWTPVPSW